MGIRAWCNATMCGSVLGEGRLGLKEEAYRQAERQTWEDGQREIETAMERGGG